MTTTNWQVEDLISRYVEGDLTEAEAQELLSLARKSRGVSDLLLDSVTANFLLREKYRVARRKIQEEGTDHWPDGSEEETEERPLVDWSLPVEAEATVDPFAGLSREEAKACRLSMALLGKSREAINRDPYEPFAIYRVEERLERESQARQREEAHQRHKWHWNDYFLALSLIILVLLGCGIIWQDELTRNNEPDILKDFRAIARVSEVIDVVWEEGTLPIRRGQPLGEATFAFTRGTVQLEMGSGASLILQGPCKFSVLNSMEAYCYEGRVSATVPAGAIGFSVATPFGNVVDRGTEFFLNVDRNDSQVTVIKGKVDLASSKGKFQSLVEGMASKIDILQVMENIPPVPEQYYTKEQFKADATVYGRQLAKEESLARDQMREKPNLLALFDMTASGSSLENLAREGSSHVTRMTLENCKRSNGPFAGTRAVSFNETSDAAFNVQGEYTSLTLLARIRVDSTENVVNPILVSRDWGDRLGSFGWYVSSDGMIYVSISGVSSRGVQNMYRYATPLFFKKEVQGTWVTVAVVLDGEKKEIYHYADGRLLTRRPWQEDIKLVPGDLKVGSTQIKAGADHNLNLDGAIAEVQMYGRALSHGELNGLMRHNARNRAEIGLGELSMNSFQKSN